MQLAQMLGYVTVIPPLPLAEAKSAVENAAAAALESDAPSNKSFLDTIQPA
jgi:hypothetical protein